MKDAVVDIIMAMKETVAAADIIMETVKDAIMDMVKDAITDTAKDAITDMTEETAAAATDNRYLYI